MIQIRCALTYVCICMQMWWISWLYRLKKRKIWMIQKLNGKFLYGNAINVWKEVFGSMRKRILQNKERNAAASTRFVRSFWTKICWLKQLIISKFLTVMSKQKLWNAENRFIAFWYGTTLNISFIWDKIYINLHDENIKTGNLYVYLCII